MASMGLKIYAGRTLCLPIPDPTCPHLYISLTGSYSVQDAKIILANLTKLGSGRGNDTTVIIQPGDHPFIQVLTVVNYKDAFIADASRILRLVSDGKAYFREDCDPDLLDRIQHGALTSEYIDPEVRAVVESYLC
jgi:hypothetical protein